MKKICILTLIIFIFTGMVESNTAQISIIKIDKKEEMPIDSIIQKVEELDYLLDKLEKYEKSKK